MYEQQETLNALSLMGLRSVKQDTQEHRIDLKDTNSKIDRLEHKVDNLEQSVQQLNIAITNLVNSQIQTNQKIDKLSEQTSQKMDKLSEQTNQKIDKLVDKLDKLADKVEKLWRERWLYRIFPLSILGIIGIGIWQTVSNWDSISNFFNAMNTFFQNH